VGRPTRRYAESPAARKIIMEQVPQKEPIPKKSVMVTIMFGIEDNQEAMVFKDKLDVLVKDIEPKRYTFQMSET